MTAVTPKSSKTDAASGGKPGASTLDPARGEEIRRIPAFSRSSRLSMVRK
jgi:hypothetical protein